MRPYRRMTFRYARLVRAGDRWPFADLGFGERVRLLAQLHWRPDADVYETATAVEVVVDLAGVEDDDVEVQLFADALVVTGRRRIPACPTGAVYHAAGIRQGPFELEVPLPAPVDPEGMEVAYERGLLRIVLPKAGTR